jgi:hypothetical protein
MKSFNISAKTMIDKPKKGVYATSFSSIPNLPDSELALDVEMGQYTQVHLSIAILTV